MDEHQTHNEEKLKILVLFYSFTGNTAKLAREIAEGAKMANTEVKIMQIPEQLPPNFFDDKPELKQIREALNAEFPVATVDDFINADGVALGTPTHFGSFASQVKQFIDQFSPIWLEGKVTGKPVALFCSAGSIHAGEEATLISLMIPLLNLGMIPVGIPYPIAGEGPQFDAGSPYGAIYVSGHNTTNPNELPEDDKKVSRILGNRLAAITHKLNCTCNVCLECVDLTKRITE